MSNTYKVFRYKLSIKYDGMEKTDGVEELEAQMNALAAEGYKFVAFVDVMEGLKQDRVCVMEKEI